MQILSNGLAVATPTALAVHPERRSLLERSASPHRRHCSGAIDHDRPHVLALVLGIGIHEPVFEARGARGLDDIIAFDLAETDTASLGGINLTTVSSFLGPRGLLLGHDVVLDPSGRLAPASAEGPPSDGAGHLLEEAVGLFGTIGELRYPFFPGSRVPCAHKSFVAPGPTVLFATVGVGIPKDRLRHPCVLMEDAGAWSHGATEAGLRGAVAESVRTVAQIQGIPLAAVHVGLRRKTVDPGLLGCALVACPYFLPASETINGGPPS